MDDANLKGVRKMVRRVFCVVFISAVLGAPIAGLASLIAAPETPQAVAMQKSMCLMSGVSCGTGPVLLPAIGRL